MIQRGEFALHEFGSYEYGSGASTLVHSSGYIGAGESSLDAPTLVFAHGDALASGASALAFIGKAYQNAQLHTQGQAAADPQAVLVQATRYGGTAQTLMSLASGVGIGVTFSATGEAHVDYLILDGYEYHITGSSALQLWSSVTANLTSSISSEAVSTLLASALISGDMRSQGSGELTARIQTLSAGSMSARGDAEVRFDNQRVHTAQAHGEGSGEVSGRSQTVTGSYSSIHGESSVSPLMMRVLIARLQAAGLAQVHPVGDAKAFLETFYTTQGASLVLTQGTHVLPVNATAEGSSDSLWLRGRNTLRYLEPSVYVVIRPEELRKVEWKK